MKNFFNKTILLGVVVLWSSVAPAPSSASNQLVEPEYVHRPPPTYPRSQVLRGSAGGVEISLMVDSTGKTYDVIASRSSHPDFEQSAINAAKRYVYSPAMLNGKAIPVRQKVVIYYEIEGQRVNQISSRYYRRYAKLQKRLSQENRDEDKLAGSFSSLALRARTRCDHAMTAMLRSVQPLLTDGDDFRIEEYRRALIFDFGYAEGSTCFDQEQRSYLKSGLLNLLMKNQYLGEALYEYQESKKINLPTVVSQFSAAIEKIKSDLAKPFSTERNIVIPRRGHSEIELFGTRFSISGKTEEVDALILRCETGHSYVALRDDHQYVVPDGLDGCQLQISASQGANIVVQENV